ncbi:hypothetical protein ACPCSC_30345 [Streptomyces lavendulocolor]|uniref:hypothetical protein n=1 Tax=Streptomyces lavendulocolor TaxID=67316 RepID=UPI003C2D56EA
MPEKDNAPTVDPTDLALRAAVAYRVKRRVEDICNPVIKANAASINGTKGMRSLAAELPLPDGTMVPLGTFTRSMAKAKFVIEDRKAVLDYADKLGETEYVIRPAFETALLARLVFKNGEVIDTVTGEIVQGINYEPGHLTETVSPKWDNAGIETLDDLLGFVDAALERLPELTAADFSLPVLEAAE